MVVSERHKMHQGKEKQKIYCYVDETGQDTAGEFFIVAVVMSGEERDLLAKKLEAIELNSGKGKVKWMQAKHQHRMDYINTVLGSEAFKHKLYFSSYKNSKAYMALTVLSTAKAILIASPQNSTKKVYVDGLPKARLRWFGTELRRLSIRNCKVSRIRREESDALAGFVRLAYLRRKGEESKLFEQAINDGYVKEE